MNFVHRPHRLIGDFIAQGGAAETLQPPQRPSGDRQEAGTRPLSPAAKRSSGAPGPGARRAPRASNRPPRIRPAPRFHIGGHRDAPEAGRLMRAR